MKNKKRTILLCPHCKKGAVNCYCGSFNGDGTLTESAKRAKRDKKDKTFID